MAPSLRTQRRRARRRARSRAAIGGIVAAAALVAAGDASALTLIRSDLDFILQQIRISENHAGGGQILGDGPNQVSSPRLMYGLRTVSGEYNNIIPGQERLGAADTLFPRLTDPFFRAGDELTFDPDGPGPQDVGQATSYTQTGGVVEDSHPRIVSNLVVDQTPGNPAAQAAADQTDGSVPVDDGNPGIDDPFFIPNTAPDEGLSARFNSWFTLFGQFFDHGLDLVTKGGAGTVIVPLQPDDPLFVPGGQANFMVLTRATNQPGGVHEHTNTTTAFVDQNQTYTSHPSHQVFLREYELDGSGRPVATGRLLEGADGGLADWDDVTAQALTMLGIQLDAQDALNVPLVRTDPYGRFVPDPGTGFPQIVTAAGPPPAVDSGTPGDPVDASTAVRTGHAFLDDIAHHAVPFGDHDADPATPRQPLTPDALAGTADDGDPATYDDEMLGRHFITGDGRGNENIGLTSVHHVFHSEHNRLVDELKTIITNTGDTVFMAEWHLPGGAWNGERLFQAARFVTEMQYQHLVFEEFARKVQPQVNIFAGYHTEVDPSIVAEFAHTVYRFGHSMLTESVDRTLADGTNRDMRLLEAFLNPLAFTDDGALTPGQAAGAVARGMTRQVGNEIDEFVTNSLRTNLLGLPLDLAAINLARGRDTGVPPLNAARRTFFAATSHAALRPYSSWEDFRLGIRHPESLINFIAAYGTHPSVAAATSVADKRAAAALLVLGGAGAPADRLDFVRSEGAWANGPGGVTTTGVDDIDLWIGGLAEKQMPFGGLLGTTFNYVFETQMERLQDGDRFYYLGRLAGLNLLTQLEENSFAELVMRNTDTHHLPHDVFSRPDFLFEVGGIGPPGGPVQDDPGSPDDESAHLTWLPNDTIRFVGGEHIVMGGTSGPDRMRADIGDDTLWGGGGDDRLEGGAGNDAVNGEDGDDILTDLFGDDNMKGGAGNDAMNAGSGFDLLLAGTGDDFVVAGADPKETFGGTGDDLINAGDSSDTVFGNEGDDWIEGGAQADLLQGGNGDPFQEDTQTGHDVIIGDGGDDDYDSEGGDDIMVTGPGIERNEGMLGFDWVTHRLDPQPARADMSFTGLLPPDIDNIRDRFDLVEGLSGWNHDDILRGDDLTAADQEDGHELTQAGIDRIAGLQDVLGADATGFTGGNIILGGDGSDIIEGRGGNDLIDGDAWLDVQLEAPAPGGGTQRVSAMSALQASVFAGDLDPGDISIARTIRVAPSGPGDIDTAEFSDVRANYDLVLNPDEPGLVTVVHARGTQSDGTDTLRNVERVRFSDQTVEIVDILTNTPAGGTVTVSDTTPLEGQALTATQAVTDPDGVNAGSIVFHWQTETDPGVFTTVRFGPTFTPDDGEVGARLRVVAVFQDGDGVLESVASAPTDAVANVNDPPTGAPTINDTTPQQGQSLTALTGGVNDRDGLQGVTFGFRWQEGDGTTFTDIVGATGPAFTPGADQAGDRLRVVVSYTDNNGTAEVVESAATAPVVAPPPPPPPAAPLGPPAQAAGPAGGPAAEPAPGGGPTPLAVSALRILQPANSGGTSGAAPVSVSLRLSTAAVVRIEVRRPGGALVRRILRRATAGRTTVRWNLRDHRGRRVAAGRYRVVVTVTSGDAKKVMSRTIRVR